jgi:hypothetical protein
MICDARLFHYPQICVDSSPLSTELNAMKSQHEFVSQRAQAHATAVAGIAQDPLVQAALAQRAADIEVKAAMAARAAARNRKDDPAPIVAAVLAPAATQNVSRRQAG